MTANVTEGAGGSELRRRGAASANDTSSETRVEEGEPGSRVDPSASERRPPGSSFSIFRGRTYSRMPPDLKKEAVIWSMFVFFMGLAVLGSNLERSEDSAVQRRGFRLLYFGIGCAAGLLMHNFLDRLFR
ncbi:MAG: hypothetical protein K940chlam7_01029 [Chlamydiae bacterium]|nr:hypothetical protein [Chlamydiota bacterium]